MSWSWSTDHLIWFAGKFQRHWTAKRQQKDPKQCQFPYTPLSDPTDNTGGIWSFSSKAHLAFKPCVRSGSGVLCGWAEVFLLFLQPFYWSCLMEGGDSSKWWCCLSAWSVFSDADFQGDQHLSCPGNRAFSLEDAEFFIQQSWFPCFNDLWIWPLVAQAIKAVKGCWWDEQGSSTAKLPLTPNFQSWDTWSSIYVYVYKTDLLRLFVLQWCCLPIGWACGLFDALCTTRLSHSLCQKSEYGWAQLESAFVCTASVCWV